MFTLPNALKNMLNGLAHEDAGEFLTMRQKSAVMSNANIKAVEIDEPAPAPKETAVTSNKRRRVAMFLGSELPASMMDYIIETCSSLGHDLSVLTFETSNTADTLTSPYAARLAEKGIDMTIIKLSGEPAKGLARYLGRRPEIAFLACKDSGYLGRNYMNGNQTNFALPVPVVVVATGPANADTQPAQQAEVISMTGTES